MPEEHEEDAIDLPKREAMSLLFDPTTALGGIAPTGGTAPTSGTDPSGSTSPVGGTGLGGSLLGGGSTTPAADPNSMASVPTPGGGSLSLPSMPTPAANPDGTYQPDASSTSQ